MFRNITNSCTLLFCRWWHHIVKQNVIREKCSTLKMSTTNSSETLVIIYRTTQCQSCNRNVATPWLMVSNLRAHSFSPKLCLSVGANHLSYVPEPRVTRNVVTPWLVVSNLRAHSFSPKLCLSAGADHLSYVPELRVTSNVVKPWLVVSSLSALSFSPKLCLSVGADHLSYVPVHHVTWAHQTLQLPEQTSVLISLQPQYQGLTLVFIQWHKWSSALSREQ
jgi:hypothetical protein